MSESIKEQVIEILKKNMCGHPQGFYGYCETCTINNKCGTQDVMNEIQTLDFPLDFWELKEYCGKHTCRANCKLQECLCLEDVFSWEEDKIKSIVRGDK